MLNTAHTWLYIKVFCLHSLPIVSWKTESYVSFSFHQYLFPQKNTQGNSHHCSQEFITVSQACEASPVASPPVSTWLPQITTCLSLGSLQSNPWDKHLRWKLVFGGWSQEAWWRARNGNGEGRKGVNVYVTTEGGLHPKGASERLCRARLRIVPPRAKQTGVFLHQVFSLISWGSFAGALTSVSVQPALMLWWPERDPRAETQGLG